MAADSFFTQALVYLSAAVVSVPIAKKLGLGSVLGYLIAGIIIGPAALGWVGEEGKDILHFAEFGVVMMLFIIGLELEPALLWRMRKSILGLGGMQVVATAILITSIAIFLNLNWQASVAIGLILALSSTAIVLQTLNEKGLMNTVSGQNSFAVLLFQDIAVIPILALMPLLITDVSNKASDGQIAFIDQFPSYLQTIIVLGAVASIIVAGKYIIRPVFRIIAGTKLRELFTAAALLLVIGITVLMSLVGLSPALGTFLAGVVLANSEYRHELISDIDPFKGLLLGLFFISVGASIDFNLILANPTSILLLVAGLMLLKGIILFVLGRFFKMGLDQNLLFSFSLAQMGEFAFVLFSFTSQNNIIEPALTSKLIAVVAVSMALTPLLMLINEKLILPRIGTKEKDERETDTILEKNPVIIAGFGKYGNIVGRLLMANGVGTTVLDYNSDRVEILRKLGLKVYYGDPTRHDLLHAAGADDAKIIIVALESDEQSIELVETIKKHFPHLKIMVRAGDRFDAYEHIESGVNHVYRETLDSSLRMGTDALKLLGFRAYQAQRAAHKFFKYDEKALKELATIKHDKKLYLDTAKNRIAELEELIKADLADTQSTNDLGWDTESLRKQF